MVRDMGSKNSFPPVCHLSLNDKDFNGIPNAQQKLLPAQTPEGAFHLKDCLSVCRDFHYEDMILIPPYIIDWELFKYKDAIIPV